MSAFLETREGRRAGQRTSPEASDFLRDNPEGWRVVSRRSAGFGRGGDVADRCGLVAHSGVIHPDEYVDWLALGDEVRRRLGVSRADLDAAYCQGRKSAATAALRDRIDARLLEVAEAGGNMTRLADVLFLDTQTIGRALARARQRREAT